MKVVYIAGPYRSPTIRGVVANIRRAETVAMFWWHAGWAAICPHLNTALFDGSAPDDVWLRGDLELLRRSDAVCMVDGWEKSQGAQAEHDLAKQLGLPIFYWPLADIPKGEEP